VARARNPTSTLSSGVEDWWTDYERSLRRRGRSEQTLALYRRAYVNFWTWAAARGLSDPTEVTRDVVNEWTSHELDRLAPTSVLMAWRSLRAFFGWYEHETGRPNPFAGADRPREPDAEVPVLADEDIRRLLAACEGRDFAALRDRAVVLVLVDTGLRLGELVGLRVEDWDRRADVLYVSGKTGPRAVALSPGVGEALARYVRARNRRPDAERWPDLWLGRFRPLTGSGVAQLLARRCKAAGLPRINPHRFRHTWAHNFRAAGGSEGDLLYLAGWRSAEMARRYGRSAAGERARDAARRLGLGDRFA